MRSNKQQISIWLPIELIDLIDKLAKKESRNRSNMIRYLLRKLLRKNGE